jgi:hypothetical protein
MKLQCKRHIYTFRLATRILLDQVLGELRVNMTDIGLHDRGSDTDRVLSSG